LGVVRPPQDLHDAPLCRTAAYGVGSQFRHHLLAVFGPAAPLGGDGDHQVEALLFRDDDSAAPCLLVASHDAGRGAFYYRNDPSLKLSAPHAAPLGAHLHSIAVHGALHLPHGDEDVFAAPLRGDEAVAVAVGGEPAAHPF